MRGHCIDRIRSRRARGRAPRDGREASIASQRRFVPAGRPTAIALRNGAEIAVRSVRPVRLVIFQWVRADGCFGRGVRHVPPTVHLGRTRRTRGGRRLGKIGVRPEVIAVVTIFAPVSSGGRGGRGIQAIIGVFDRASPGLGSAGRGRGRRRERRECPVALGGHLSIIRLQRASRPLRSARA
jgi:hypothetical protein